ncbi:MAG: cation:proton antiporter [Candidatus Hodarchaeales archaeon]|jgi:Kef-type K+ transport system membrane component KefB
MTDFSIFLIIGLILTIGVFGSDLLKKIKFPQILGFLLVGIVLNIFLTLIGQEFVITEFLDIIVAVTLAFIGFNLGSEIDWKTIRSMSMKILIILLSEALLTFFAVTIVVYMITTKLHLALVFGALASATAPAGTAAVFWENDCKGPLTTAAMFILALDDIVAIVLTDIAIDYATLFYRGHAIDLVGLFLPVIYDIVASLALGMTSGFSVVYLLNREEDHGEYVDLVIGSIFVCIGIASILGISYILPTMIFGVTVASLCRKPDIDFKKKKLIEEVFGTSSPEITSIYYEKIIETRDEESEPHQIFHEVFRIASPFIAMFFVLIGLSLDLTSIVQIGFVGVIYMATRTIAKAIGSNIGASLAKAEPVIQKYLGFCLLSQAGVALGLAVLISEHFATFGSTAADTGLFILSTITATTIVFQIFGPVAIKWAIDRSGEAGKLC